MSGGDIDQFLEAELAGLRTQAEVEAAAKRHEEAKFTALLDSQKAILECLQRIEALLARGAGR